MIARHESNRVEIMVRVPKQTLPPVRVGCADILLNRSLNSVAGAFCLSPIMEVKICNTCKQEKSLDQFNKGGKEKYCRSCVRARYNRWLAKVKADPDDYKRFNTLRKACRSKWNEAHPDYFIRYYSEYRGAYDLRPQNKAKIAELMRKWKKANPEKIAAHRMINNRIYRGVLKRPETCSRCRSSIKIQAHHPDYSKPLEVVWLCYACHCKEHGKTARQTTTK